MNEFELIRTYFADFPVDASVVEGIGDDAAVLQPPQDQLLVQTTDTLIAGVHFPVDASAADIAHKALMVNLSDIAAMAATPLSVTLSITLPEVDEPWLHAFAERLQSLCKDLGLNLIGGDTTRGPLAISITVTGAVEPEKYVLREGAQVADEIYVSNTIGDAALGLALWQGNDKTGVDGAIATERFHRPQARLDIGQALGGIATSMLDCSDGLFDDLQHILTRSGVGAEINVNDIPVSAAVSAYCESMENLLAFLNGGDDYELVFTAATAQRDEIAARTKNLSCSVQRIGKIVAGNDLLLRDKNGKTLDLETRGYKHFV